jgi:DUF1680 family protein
MPDSSTNAVVVDTSHSPHAALRPVPLNAVHLDDAFWAPRIARNRDVTIPSQFAQLEETGTIDNFRRTAGTKDVAFRGPQFADSDAYKWLEAAASTLAAGASDEVRAMVDTVADAIEGAQRPDGYLNTYFAKERADDRWKTVTTERNWMHELYCAGHFFQAAIAHFRATGERKLLDVATRYADHIGKTFGPGDDQQHGFCGHPEVEMALIELYRATGEARYLETAQYFLELRRGMDRMNDCWQERKPFRELERINAHAVCAVYLTSGATDFYAETGDAGFKEALGKIWTNMTTRQMYVTGGIGQRYQYEAFGSDFELPAYAYAETCASIGSVMWNWRMLLVTGEAKYADILELALYNGLLSGLSLDGEHYFYTNPLTDDGTHRREAWFGCACCPPNVARLLAQLTGYFYSTTDSGAIYAHLYADGKATITLPSGGTVALTQRTQYPWDGTVTITVDQALEMAFALHLRVPGWAGGATIAINGERGDAVLPGAYHAIDRVWSAGDTVTLILPMPVRKVIGHPAVEATHGKLALLRGPLVYCLEAADNEGVDVKNVHLRPDTAFEATFEPELLGGVVVLRGTGTERSDGDWDGPLYQPVEKLSVGREVSVTAIPYHTWANREAGAMRVWVPMISPTPLPPPSSE